MRPPPPASRAPRRALAFALLAGLALLPTRAALAQGTLEPVPRPAPQSLRPVRPSDPQSNLAREMLQAQQLMKRDPEAAHAQLEPLLARHPEHAELQYLVARACRLTGRLAPAERLLRSLRERYPEAQGYLGELALVLLRAGKDEEAKALLAELYRQGPPRAGSYEAAASLLLDQSRPDLVEAIYREGLLALPLADEGGRLRLVRRLLELYNLTDQPLHTLRLLAETSAQLKEPGLREALLDEGERFLAEAPEPARLLPLADSLAAGPSAPRLAPLLRQIYLAVGDHARFADEVLRAPQPAGARAHWLYGEGLRCLEDSDRGGPDAAARRRAAADRLFSAGLAEARTSPSLRAMLHYQLARLRLEEDAEARLRGTPPTPAATAALRALLADLRREQPGGEWATRALIDELHLLRDRLGEAAAADSLLRAWLLEPERGRSPIIEAALELELGENLLAAGRFAEAKGHYESLLRPERGGETQPGLIAWARFRSAELLLLAGDAQAAQDSLAALAETDPGAALANDALDLALLLAEAANWPESVRARLLAACQQEFGGDPAGAAALLLGFAAEYPEDEASPALLYRAGQLELRALRGAAALAAWLLLADRHPDDQRAPQALEQAARLALRLGDAPRARTLLARILAEHPDFRLRPSLRDLQDLLKENA
ncbi:tetratricopeptide repeat protein [bacterium]|nr:tetratricopeptide repeat protein [bacterium]